MHPRALAPVLECAEMTQKQQNAGWAWDTTFHVHSCLSFPSTFSTTVCPADHVWRAELCVHCQGFLAAVCNTASRSQLRHCVRNCIQSIQSSGAEQTSLRLQVAEASSCSAPQHCLKKEISENPYLRGRTIQVAVGKRGCQQSD